MVIDQTDSESLLEQLSSLPARKRRGKLKIYFGYAAGVGKTCAMLRDAHEAKENGVDVVAGYIEPHVRPETTALIEGLESLPFLELSYKGIKLKEFDLDRALQRRPEIILVDELAHTNAAGCRHVKRYQDVEELLQAGIDVFTTINVQHIESLNDIVESITGVYVRERIPDSVFDSADQIELVDIEPDVEAEMGLAMGASTRVREPVVQGEQVEQGEESDSGVESVVSRLSFREESESEGEGAKTKAAKKKPTRKSSRTRDVFSEEESQPTSMEVDESLGASDIDEESQSQPTPRARRGRQSGAATASPGQRGKRRRNDEESKGEADAVPATTTRRRR